MIPWTTSKASQRKSGIPKWGQMANARGGQNWLATIWHTPQSSRQSLEASNSQEVQWDYDYFVLFPFEHTWRATFLVVFSFFQVLSHMKSLVQNDGITEWNARSPNALQRCFGNATHAIAAQIEAPARQDLPSWNRLEVSTKQWNYCESWDKHR